MQVFPFPSALSHIELELFKAPFESFQFSSLAPGFRMFEGKLLEVGAHQTGQGSVALNGNLADFLNQVPVNGKRNVHKPIIRETLNMDRPSPIKLVTADGDLIRRAVEAQASYGLHFYDCLIIAAAERGGCARIWSEDFNVGQKYFGVSVANPFA